MIKRYMKITAVRLKISQNKLKQEKAQVHFDAPVPLTPHGRAVRDGVIVDDLVSYRVLYMVKRRIKAINIG